MHSDQKLIASGICVYFGGIAALDDVDLELGVGEIVGLIGSNGAGKSTMINVLSGYQVPDRGRVACGSKSFAGLAPHRVAREGIVRTFQSVRLFRELTVRENVAAAAAVVHAKASRVDSLLAMLGLGDLKHQKAGSLPYAHQRRVAIARSLALSPKFLLLDEPAAGMTPQEVVDIDRTLVSLRNDAGMGLLLVEHNMSLVMQICERLIVMDSGRVIARGAPESIQADPAVRQAYLGYREAR